jgi:hypothetical protein
MSHYKWLLAATLGLAGAFGTTPASASFDMYQNMGNKLCVDVEGWGTHNGARIAQWACHGGGNQRFQGVGYNWGLRNTFAMRNAHSNKCWDVPFGNAYNGAPVQQWDCHGGYEQRWSNHTLGGTSLCWSEWCSYRFGDDFCLDVPGGSTQWGARLQIWRCDRNMNQAFRKIY